MREFRKKLLALLWGLLICGLLPSQAAAQLPGLIPDFCANPDKTSAGTGNWDSAGTWTPSGVPTAGQVVRIATGHTVTIRTILTPAHKCVGIASGGVLTFDPTVNTKLRTAMLMPYEGGTLNVGTVDTPIASGHTADIAITDTALDTTADPERYGTGFISFGTVRMHGTIRSTTFKRLAAAPGVGAATLTLATAPTGWAVGDTVVIPDTRALNTLETKVYGTYSSQVETRTISGISGATVTLSNALTYAHAGSPNGAEYLPHVANLTRNCRITSENPNGTRGHVLFTHRADIDIRYCSFDDLGRTLIATEPDSTTFSGDGLNHNGNVVTHLGTNQIGRYSLHMHHYMGPIGGQSNGHAYTLIGNEMARGTKWGIAIHASHFGLIDDNVMYQNNGAALMTEDCSESYNYIQNNIAFGGEGAGPRDSDTGRSPVGYFFRGPNNYVTGNVAVGFQPSAINSNPDTGYGFKYYQAYCVNAFNPSPSSESRVPNIVGADTDDDAQITLTNMNAVPIRQFENNEVYGATESGLSYWWVGAFGGDNLYTSVGPSTIKNLVVWNTFNLGIFQYQAANFTIDGWVYRNPPDLSRAIAYYGADYAVYNHVIKNSSIIGYAGIIPSEDGFNSTQTFQDSTLQTVRGFEFDTLWISSADASSILARTVNIRNVTFTPPTPNEPSFCSLCFSYRGRGSVWNLIQQDVINVYDYNGNVGNNFRAYYSQQASDFVVPQTVIGPYGFPTMLGSPASGLTNSQNWAQYGIAIGGAVAPCTVAITEVQNGFICGGSFPAPPSSPTSVTLIQ